MSSAKPPKAAGLVATYELAEVLAKHWVAPSAAPREAAKAQAETYADAVTDRVRRLEVHAARLGARFGITSAFVPLSQKADAPQAESSRSNEAPGAEAARERVVLQKHDGQWGLFLYRTAPHEPLGKCVALRDASLNSRVQFLNISESFLREYIETGRKRLEELKSAVEAADRALAMLEDEALD